MIKLKTLTVLLALIFSASVAADNATFNAKVRNILVDDSYYAGCMIALTVDPQTLLPNCASSWGTLDCSKEFPESTASLPSNKLAQAQLALVTGMTVRVRMTDTRMANGYCFVARIDVNDRF